MNIKRLSDLRKSKTVVNNPQTDEKRRFSLESDNEVGTFGSYCTLTDPNNLLQKLDKRISYELFIKRKEKGPSRTKVMHLLRLLVIFLLILFFSARDKYSRKIQFSNNVCMSRLRNSIHFVNL